MRSNQDLSAQTKIYLFSYVYDNATWNVEISAYSKEDAEQKIKSISNSKYDGELKITIPVPSYN